MKKKLVILFTCLSSIFSSYADVWDTTDSLIYRFELNAELNNPHAKEMHDSVCEESSDMSAFLCCYFSSFIGNKETKIKKLFESIEYIQKHKTISKKYLVLVYVNIGYFYYNENDLDNAIKYAHLAYENTKKTQVYKSDLYYRDCLSLLALAYFEKHDTINALFYQKTHNETYESYDKIPLISKFDYYFLQNQLDSVLKYGKIYLEKAKYGISTSDVLWKTGQLYLQRNDTLTALKYILDAYNNSVSTENQTNVFHLSGAMSSIYRKLGNNDKALYYKNIQDSLRSTVVNIETIKEVAKTEYIYSNKGKENSNNSSFILYTLVFALSALILFFVLKTYNNTQLKNPFTKAQKKPQSNKHRLSPAILKEVEKKLEPFFENNLYLRKDCTIGKIAYDLKINNERTLREYINEVYSKNFNDFINSLRIDYIVNRLHTDKMFRNYTMDQIAFETGFASRTVLSAVFKRHKGIPPIEYIKSISG